ncbi:MAG: hypothetical protein WAZ34_01850 [Rhodocyclaceae bacterium]
MSSEHSDEESLDAPPKRKFRLTPAVILILLSSTFFLLLVGGSVFHFQSGSALKAELAATKKALSEKTALIDEVQAQGRDLSKQLSALRTEIAAAKAETAAALAALPPPAAAAVAVPSPPAPAVVPAKTPAAAVKPQPAASELSNTTFDAPPDEMKKTAPVARRAAAARAKLAVQDCQLVGKGAEEQATTLKRCMQILDGGR